VAGISLNVTERVRAGAALREIKTNLPERLVQILSPFNLELSTWQEIRFVYDHEKWGRPIIPQKEEETEKGLESICCLLVRLYGLLILFLQRI
jgi:hypothetical protein